MSEPRLFTPEQAQTLLDERVRDLAERMVSERASSRELETRWNAVVIAIGGNGGDFDRPELTELRTTLEQAHDGLRAIMAELADLGVEIKDVDRGLLDFPSEIDGHEALLCWMVGEQRIGFWHSREDGFAGRQSAVSAGTELNAALAAEARGLSQAAGRRDAHAELIVARDAYLASHAQTPRDQLGPDAGRPQDGNPGRLTRSSGSPARGGRSEGRGDDAGVGLRARAGRRSPSAKRPDVARMLAAGDAFDRTGRALRALAAGDASSTPRRWARSWPTSRLATTTSPGWPTPIRSRCSNVSPNSEGSPFGRAAIYSAPEWGYSSAGRAPRWQRGGRRFEPD